MNMKDRASININYKKTTRNKNKTKKEYKKYSNKNLIKKIKKYTVY